MEDRKYKILVVDDTEATRYAISRTLQKNGYETVEAATGFTALDMVLTEKPDLITLDIHLPDIIGFEVCKRIKLNKETSHIPVLQVSASYVTSKDKIHGLEGGADSYLTHPFEPPVLLATVKALLRSKQLTEDLRRSEELFRVALKNAPIMIYTCNAELQYTWMQNPIHQNKSKEEYLGKTDFSIFPTAEAVDLLVLKKQVMNSGVGVREIVTHKMGGAERHFDVTIENLEGVSEKGLAVSYIDITDRVEASRALERATDEAKVANQAKSRFLSNMSHEIRTPLGVIQGYADLALEEGLSREELKSYLEIIKRNSVGLTRLIGEILDLSKVEADKIEIEKTSFSIRDLVDEVVSAMSLQAKVKGIALTVDFASNYPDKIDSDPTRVRQVLINLVSNAIKFTSEGQVKITTRVNPTRDGYLMVFEVQDSGIGLTSEQASKLFQAFAQADSSTTRKYGGTGLGLHLSKRLAEALGGELFLKESVPGQGSTFIFTFDPGDINQNANAKSTALSAEAQRVNSKGLYSGKSVLLVDDSEDNQFLFSQYLKHLGISVQTCANGVEACDKASANSYDAILMDIQMPLMDGYAATSEIRKGNTAVPIIALTAYALKDEKVKALSNGFNDYLVKPLTAASLRESLAKVFQET